APVVHTPKIVLRSGEALIGSLAKPFHCLGLVLRHAQTIGEAHPKSCLPGSVALVSSAPIPLDCLAVILRHALPPGVHHAKDGLSLSHTFLCSRTRQALRCCVIAFAVCGGTIFKGPR